MPIIIQPITAEETWPLRHSVLWPDKPFEYVKLTDDAHGQHIGGFYNGKLIAVISLFITNDDTGKPDIARFRKFATHPHYQGQGIGTHLLNYVLEQARLAGARELWCDARLTAASFYKRFQMQPDGPIFYKGDIAYSRFTLAL